jgi:(S)-ureidoglycine aminohydrolase
MNTTSALPSPVSILTTNRAVYRHNEYIIVPTQNRCGNEHLSLRDADEQLLVTPKQGAGYQMSVFNLHPGGGTRTPLLPGRLETFVYVLDGDLTLTLDGRAHELTVGGYAWLPPQSAVELRAAAGARLIWFQRPYQPLPGVPAPAALFGREQDVEAIAEVDINPEKQLIPYTDPAFDMAFNLIEVPPGAFYGLVEQHAWEHAMYMLDGAGTLFLNGQSFPVQTDDFIYIAPYIPEWFTAQGLEPKPVRFLLHWDCNRGFEHFFPPTGA